MRDRFLFRIWDKESRKYHNGMEVFDYMRGLLKEDKYVMEQATGLKDKNGRLIYEGDIVRVDEDIAKIGWSDLSSQWVIESEDDIFDFDNTYGEDCVVIGNIHENPELLESDNAR